MGLETVNKASMERWLVDFSVLMKHLHIVETRAL